MGKRVKLDTTVAPETVDRLRVLCDRYSTTQGRVVDKLVAVLNDSLSTGELLCISGSRCPMNRKDVPTVL